MVSRGEWSGQDDVLMAERARRIRHLFDRFAAVRPVRVDVAIAAKCLTERAGRLGQPVLRFTLEALQVRRLAGSKRFQDRTLNDRADALQVAQAVFGHEQLELAGTNHVQCSGRAAEDARPKRRLTGSYEEERNAFESFDGVHVFSLGQRKRDTRGDDGTL